MLIQFFMTLKQVGIPVSIRELLDLIEALKHRLAFADVDDFYHLARIVMVKDEKYFDRYDRAFAVYFRDLENLDDVLAY